LRREHIDLLHMNNGIYHGIVWFLTAEFAEASFDAVLASINCGAGLRWTD
jgi:hypothetical protein